MTLRMSRLSGPLLSFASVACALFAVASTANAGPHDALIAKHAVANGVPEALVRRVIKIESGGNARAAHAGNYGLMQIRLGTARGVGYSGDELGLLDPETNLTYGVKYLAGAYRAAGCDADRAVAYYRRGYYGRTQSECSAALPAAARIAQGEANFRFEINSGVKAKADVLKPRLVRIEAIGATNPAAAAPARFADRFGPMRVSVLSVPSNESAAAEAPAKLELASIPLPPVRPALDPMSEPAKHAKLRHHAGRRHHAKQGDLASAKKDEDPIGVVSFIKKLVPGDAASSKRKRHSQAVPSEQ
jgi:transglycosylase-like protein with SLT domain